MAHLILLYQVLLLMRRLEVVQSSPVLEIDVGVEIALCLMDLLLHDAIAASLDVVIALNNDVWSTPAYKYLCWYA